MESKKEMDWPVSGWLHQRNKAPPTLYLLLTALPVVKKGSTWAEGRKDCGPGVQVKQTMGTYIRTKSDCLAAKPGDEYFSTSASVLKPNL